MIDLTIYEEFISDYNNPQLTLNEIMFKHGLNNKRFKEMQDFAKLKGDIPLSRRMNRTNAKFYTKTNNGYIVKKQFGNECVFVGRFKDEETAKMVVNKCKEVNWNISSISDFIDKHKIKPSNYTCSEGSYIVQKTIRGKNTVFCKVNNETTAQKVVEELRKCNWNKEKTKEIIKKVKT